MSIKKFEIFKNNFFLIYKDENIQKLYFLNQYTLKKILIFQMFEIIFTLTNSLINSYLLVRNEYIISKEKVNRINTVILSVQFTLFTINILANYCERLKKQKVYVFMAVSLFCYYNLFIQSQILKEILNNSSGEFINEYVLPSIQSGLLIFYVLFIDQNFILISMGCIFAIATIILVSLGRQFEEDWVSILFLISFVTIQIFFTYLHDKSVRRNFVLYENEKRISSERKDFIENMYSGVLILTKDNSYQVNSKMKEILNINDKQITDSEIFEKIKKFILLGYAELNEKVNEKLKNLFTYNTEIPNLTLDTLTLLNKENLYKKMIIDIFEIIKYDKSFEKFSYIGNKIFNNYTLRINLRYNVIAKTIEFCATDISSIIEFENLKVSSRYKKLFLNKFSHEFKNPLLNIKQIVSNMKTKYLENDCFKKNLASPISHNQNNDAQEVKLQSTNYFNINNLTQNLHQLNSNNAGQIDKTDLTHIKDLTNYMISLIGDFDFISNSELQNFPVELSENKITELSKFKIRKLIKECLRIFKTRSELNEKNIRFIYEIESKVPVFLNSDFRRLKQILLNILSNSYKFTNNGEIKIRVKLDKEPNLIKFEILDSGTGFNTKSLGYMAREDLMWQMNNKEINNNIYGMGLGLKIVKILVSLLGKNFNISSNHSSGTLVSFCINSDLVCSSLLEQKILSISSHFEIEGDKNKSQISLRVEMKPNIINMSQSKVETFVVNEFKHKKSKIDRSRTLKCNLDPKLKKTLISKITEEDVKLDIELNSYNKPYFKILPTSEAEDSTLILDTVKFYISQDDKIIRKDDLCEKIYHNFSKSSELRNHSPTFKDSSSKDLIKNHKIANDNSMSNKTLKILLVDDEKLIRQSEAKIITKYFYKINIPLEIQQCADGAECIYHLYRGILIGDKYDIIITDETMNFMRGSLMATTIKSLINDNMMYDIKIFMVTSYESSTIINNFHNIIDGVITKPLSQEHLIKIFEKVI